MKKRLLTLSIIILLLSCNDNNNLQFVDQEIIEGRISATKTGTYGGYGIPSQKPRINVQSPTDTREVEIPFNYEGRWKLGLSIVLNSETDL